MEQKTPKKKPGGQPGNKNARIHGAFSKQHPIELSALKSEVAHAIRQGDWYYLTNAARALRDQDEPVLAWAVRAKVHAFRDAATVRAGKRPPPRRQRIPPAVRRALGQLPKPIPASFTAPSLSTIDRLMAEIETALEISGAERPKALVQWLEDEA